MSKWIKVTDRLPERGVDVLVMSNSGGACIKHIPMQMTAREKRLRGISDDTVVSGDGGKHWYPGGLNIHDTSHWMPIPALED